MDKRHLEPLVRMPQGKPGLQKLLLVPGCCQVWPRSQKGDQIEN